MSINTVAGGQDQNRSPEAYCAAGKPSPQVVGASTPFSVTFTEENTSTSAGTEILRVYLH